jgi:hypothetical protein
MIAGRAEASVGNGFIYAHRAPDGRDLPLRSLLLLAVGWPITPEKVPASKMSKPFIPNEAQQGK